MKRCQMLIYLGLGEVRNCHKRAIAIFDAGKPTGFPVCKEHSEIVHPSRLTPIKNSSVPQKRPTLKGG